MARTMDMIAAWRRTRTAGDGPGSAGARRPGRALRRGGAWLWRARHGVPPTPLGVAVAAFGLWLSFAVGAREVDYVLWTAGLVAAATVCLAAVMVLMAAIRIWSAVRTLRGRPGAADPLVLETGLTADTGLRLPALRGWPLVSLRVRWELPPEAEIDLQRHGGRFEELARPLSRCEVPRIERRLLVEDIFGFARLGLPLTLEQRLRVEPRRTRLTAQAVTRLVGGDTLSHPGGPAEGDLVEMRRYVYGDPLRHVLWKAYARTRKLLVRTPEQAVTPRPPNT